MLVTNIKLLVNQMYFIVISQIIKPFVTILDILGDGNSLDGSNLLGVGYFLKYEHLILKTKF